MGANESKADLGDRLHGRFGWLECLRERDRRNSDAHDPTVNSGNPFYYGQDHEGSETHLFNASGNVIEKYKYDAFGAPSIYGADPGWPARSSTAYNNRFLFTGREYAATYQNAYNPTLGRFTSEDPIGFQIAGEKPAPPASLMFPTQLPKTFESSEFNLFRYCHNDPLNRNDPSGLTWIVSGQLRADFEAARAYLSQDSGLKKIFEAIEKSQTNVYVVENKNLAANNKTTLLALKGGERFVRISWNPHQALKVPNGSQSPALALGHESSHAARFISDPKGTIRDANVRNPSFGNLEERRVILGPEAAAAKTLGETPRSNYEGKPYGVEDPSDR